MSLDHLRQIVSGNKARYVDSSVDLDLVYVTDRIIIMGWPATGFASTYRNRRRDVLKFINSRHGSKWWVWNLCPLYENAYSPESMSNRVSRYPFPDHHPPPLPLLPLAVREMSGWLNGDPERVAIIHCKAGKGRSGTLLCSYFLSLDELPPPPQLDTSYSQRERAVKRDGWLLVGHGDEVAEIQMDDSSPDVSQTSSRPPSSLSTISGSSFESGEVAVSTMPPYDPIDIGDENDISTSGQYDRRDGKVDKVFKLHSSRRMKPTSAGRGVSIPSQRRWCRYIHLLYTAQAPASYGRSLSSRIRLLSITMVLKPPTGWQKPLANLVVGSDAGKGRAWASVARYDDGYVDSIWSREDIAWGGVGGKGEHDEKKMFRSCGKMVSGSIEDSWLPQECRQYNVHHMIPKSDPLILDRGREVRFKYHLASVPLGWSWVIPAFHLPEPIVSDSEPPRIHTLTFPRSQIDFPLGPGQSIVQILVRVEEMPLEDAGDPAPLMSEAEEIAEGVDDQHGEEAVKEEGS